MEDVACFSDIFTRKIMQLFSNKLALYTRVLCILVAFLASQWYLIFESFSNLHFLGLAFFYIEDFYEW